MKPDHRAQQVETACQFRIEEDRTVLWEEVHTVYDYAESAAYAVRLVPNHGSKPQEYEYRNRRSTSTIRRNSAEPLPSSATTIVSPSRGPGEPIWPRPLS